MCSRVGFVRILGYGRSDGRQDRRVDVLCRSFLNVGSKQLELVASGDGITGKHDEGPQSFLGLK